MAAKYSQDVWTLEAQQEKKDLTNRTNTDISPERSPQTTRGKMLSARRLLVVLLVSFLVTCGLATAVSPRQRFRAHCREKKQELEQQQPVTAPEETSFALLLNAVSPESLHDLLHRYFPDRYKPGVYPSEHSAMEVVHRANAALATSMVQMAKRDNTTTTTVPDNTPPPVTTTDAPPPPDSTTAAPPPPSDTADTTSDQPPPPTVTDSEAPSSTVTIDIPPPTSASEENSGTTPGSAPGTSVQTGDQPAGSSSNSRPSSSPNSPNSPNSSGVTSSNAGQTTAPTKASSSKSFRKTTMTFTSTMNGTPVVVVATSYVEANQQASATSTNPNGSLQTNAAVKQHRGAIFEAMVGAVVGGAMLI